MYQQAGNELLSAFMPKILSLDDGYCNMLVQIFILLFRGYLSISMQTKSIEARDLFERLLERANSYLSDT